MIGNSSGVAGRSPTRTSSKNAAFTYTTPDYQSENFVTPGVVRHEVRTASITVGDETEAHRIAKALTDAARLCGATVIPAN